MKRRVDWSIIFVIIMLLAFVVSQTDWFDYDLQSVAGFIGGQKIHISSLWKSITTQWLHDSVYHLLVNVIALLYLSHELQKYNSTKKNFLIYISGMTFVALALLVFANEEILYIGNSGAITGLLGAQMIQLYLSGDKRHKANAIEVSLLFLGLTIVIPHISTLMHLSGFIVGLVFELLCSSRDWMRQKGNKIP